MNNFLKNILKVYSVINLFKSKLILISFITTLSVILELIGLGIFIPIIDFLTNDKALIGYHYIPDEIRLASKRTILLISIIIILIVFTFKASINIFLSFLQARLQSDIDIKISMMVFKSILMKPYEKFIQENNTSYTSVILYEVEQFSELVKYIITLLLELLVLFGIFSILIIIQPISTVIILAISLIYFILMKIIFRKRLIFWGENRQKYQDFMFRDVKNGLSSIVFIKIKKIEKYFLNIFNDSIKNRNLYINKEYTFSQFPRITLELMGVFTLCVILYINIFLIELTFNLVINQLVFFVVALTRVMPSLNRIFTSYNFINYSDSVINKIFSTLNNENKNSFLKQNTFLEFKNLIELKKVSYKFPNSKNMILDKINLKIKKNSILGIYGKSGSGKSTLINLIMGLIKPINGSFSIDGLEINNEGLDSYQKMIGLVSQKTPIIIGSIKENICFGNNKYSSDDLKWAIKLAKLEEFINKKENQLDSIIGEEGSTISGGETQRIGIARALLNKPKILILDESTNALDKKTEESILNTIKGLKSELTIVIVSHDRKVLDISDRLYNL